MKRTARYVYHPAKYQYIYIYIALSKWALFNIYIIFAIYLFISSPFHEEISHMQHVAQNKVQPHKDGRIVGKLSSVSWHVL